MFSEDFKKITWKRVHDVSRMRDIGGDAIVIRVYSPDGKASWPRFVMTIDEYDLDGKQLSFTSSVKERAGAWWNDQRGIPSELLSDVVEMWQETLSARR